MKRLFIILALAVLFWPMWVHAAGQNDTTTLADYLNSFFSRSMSGYPTPWDLDPDTSNIKRAINDALLDISTNPLLEDATAWYDTIITDSTRWYAYPVDCFEITWVSMADPGKSGEKGLEPVQKKQIGKGTTAEAIHPKFYAVDSRRIYFDPNNTVGDTIYIYYRPYAAELDSNGAVSNVIKKYKVLAVDLAIINFFSGRTGADVANVIAQAKDRIAITAAKLGVKPESVLPQIK